MKFKYEFYHYQEDILNKFEEERERGDKKIHIVAPPGSGKTIVGIEMIKRIGGNTLILVPNITLQYQWVDKIVTLFMEANEEPSELLSADPNVINNINILTYQNITQSDSEEKDIIKEQILENWFKELKDEFDNYNNFIAYTETLKEFDKDEYIANYGRFKKRLKRTDSKLTKDLLSQRVLEFFEQIKSHDIDTIIVDEAHHLTSWWSKVLYYLREYLDNPFIIGLTATPPFEDVDFFELDDDYSNLLGEVDYYVPTPAIVKSGRLAPYNDLVYFIQPEEKIYDLLKKNENNLNTFIENNKENICEYLFELITSDYEKLIKKSNRLLENYQKFVFNYSEYDIAEYLPENFEPNITLEDIAKSSGKYISNLSIKKKENNDKKKFIEETKRIFFEMGYIWRQSNFYKFRTPIEKLMIYSHSKIEACKKIILNEMQIKGGDLKCAIITDFLETNEGYINCKDILDRLGEEFENLNPILVSGQGIWQYKDGKSQEIENDIITLTNKLKTGQTNLLIGTRGILGEGWDCPSLNVLIDLTGITAFMSVNQVRGRAIRLDPEVPQKISNIYDIVCIGPGYKGKTDFERLVNKHEKFYGVDDAGIIIKGIDHVYPNLANHLDAREDLNQNMLKRSKLNEYVYGLWGIGADYENREIFGLNLEFNSIENIIPIMQLNFGESLNILKLLKTNKKLEEIQKNDFYLKMVEIFLFKLCNACKGTLKELKYLPEDFNFEIINKQKGQYKIICRYEDEIISKGFIKSISKIFSIISSQKYIIKYPIVTFDGLEIKEQTISLGLPDKLSNNKKTRDILEQNFISSFGFKKFNPLESAIGNLEIFLYIVFLGTLGGFMYNGMEILMATGVGGIIGTGFISTAFRAYKPILRLKQYNKIKSTRFGKEITAKRSIKFVYLNGKKVEKKKYIGKKPFITGKIEKLWI